MKANQIFDTALVSINVDFRAADLFVLAHERREIERLLDEHRDAVAYENTYNGEKRDEIKSRYNGERPTKLPIVVADILQHMKNMLRFVPDSAGSNIFDENDAEVEE